MHCDFRLKVLFMHEYEMLEKANCYVARVISPDAFLWKENKILYKEFCISRKNTIVWNGNPETLQNRRYNICV